MLAKVIATGPDRADALRRLRRRARRTTVLGVDDQHRPSCARCWPTRTWAPATSTPAWSSARPPTLVPPSVPDEVVRRGGAAAPGGAGACSRRARRRSGWTDPFAVPTGWRLGGEPAWTRAPAASARPRPGRRSRVRGRAGDARGPDRRRRPSARPARAATGGRPAATATTARLASAGRRAATPTPAHGDTLWLGRDGDAWASQDHDPVDGRRSAAARARAAATVTAARCPAPSSSSRSAAGDAGRGRAAAAGRGGDEDGAHRHRPARRDGHRAATSRAGSTVAMDAAARRRRAARRRPGGAKEAQA